MLKHFLITKQSLARRALVGMALRITIVIFIATCLSYWHVYTTLRSSVIENLSNYADLRGKAESEQFLLAERQSSMLRDEFLRRLQTMGNYDPKAEFDRIFVREADGLVRVRPEINDHRLHATAYLRHDVQITPDLRRRFYIGWQLLDQWGPMLVNRFFSGFMNMPEQLSINFCPTADWGRSATRETDITIYETVWRATIEKNPKRLPFWTAVYYDPGAKAWMVSRVTPGDHNGRWVVTGGQDVEIADLIRRTTATHIEKGTWNFIVDTQSNLIAHPNLTDQITRAGGNLQVSKLDDAKLAAMVKAVLSSDNNAAHAIEPSGLDVFLGVSRIRGPEWFFVTVYPRQLLTAHAFSTARIFFAVGFASLFLELVIMAIILRRRVALPIGQAVTATERISHGDFNVHLDSQRNDELGLLATSVNRMAEAVGERNDALNRKITELKAADEQIKQSLREKETLLRELYHRTKNNMQVITSLLNLQSNTINDEKTLQIFEDTKNRIRSMALVHEKLYQAKNLSHVNLSNYIRDLAESLMTNYHISKERITLFLDVEDIQLSIDTINPCGLVLNELMTNSLKYAFPDNRAGEITITGHTKEGGIIELGFSDNGTGFPEGIDFERSESLGLKIIRILVETQMNGKIVMKSADGVKFTISFKDADNIKRV